MQNVPTSAGLNSIFQPPFFSITSLWAWSMKTLKVFQSVPGPQSFHFLFSFPFLLRLDLTNSALQLLSLLPIIFVNLFLFIVLLVSDLNSLTLKWILATSFFFSLIVNAKLWGEWAWQYPPWTDTELLVPVYPQKPFISPMVLSTLQAPQTLTIFFQIPPLILSLILNLYSGIKLTPLNSDTKVTLILLAPENTVSLLPKVKRYISLALDLSPPELLKPCSSHKTFSFSILSAASSQFLFPHWLKNQLPLPRSCLFFLHMKEVSMWNWQSIIRKYDINQKGLYQWNHKPWFLFWPSLNLNNYDLTVKQGYWATACFTVNPNPIHSVLDMSEICNTHPINLSNLLEQRS